MNSVSYKIIRREDRLFFHDGSRYVLLDTGFLGHPSGRNSISADGRIGSLTVNTMPRRFFTSFINLRMADGSDVTAVFNPTDGFNCLLRGDTLTIADEDLELPEAKYFFDFVDPRLPILEGGINGRSARMLFDSGARMTMFGESELAGEKVRSYTEWMAFIQTHADLDVFDLELQFPNGFRHRGEGALVTHPLYRASALRMNIRAMLGIDIFDHYDLAVICKGAKRGIALLEK